MTTISPSSGSSAERSEAFARLHPALQRWIYDKGWTSLHDAQERAIPIVLAENQDLIISAATAAGKTEAAFLPICSVLASAERSLVRGPDVLYVSPLKALINDQYDRLDLMAGRADLVVHRWHGDVSASAKTKAADTAGGILLITPESLEAFLDRRGSEARAFLGRLRYVVIDELHSFLGTPRGAQLQSLLNRVELAARRRPPRIGLSATLGDMAVATTFLRPEAPTAPAVVVSTAEHELQLQVRGYRAPVPLAAEADEEDPATDEIAIAEHLFETVRGADNLLFANSRRQVEIFANRLADLSAERRVPNEFWPHHGSLAKAVREEVEQQLKDRSRPVTAVCTSTLELGIDIGTVTSVAQIGPPPSVAALRQRLGRSGRRDDPAVIRIYVSEEELDARTALVDHLRCDLVQTIAMVELLLDRWLESPADGGLNLSTLIQQTLALIAQHSGVMATDAHRVLCGPGPFENVDAATYAALLRDLASADLIVQAGDGTLLHGPVGERFVNHYSFYAAFETPEEWRLVVDGKTLGTMPIDHPVEIGGLLLFAGKRWRVVDVDSSAKVIELKSAAGGRPPRFGGDGPAVSGEVRARMAQIYASEDVPAYLDATARELLAEARSAWRRFGLAGAGAVTWDADTFLLPWVGDDTLWAMTLGLRRAGVDAELEGPLLRLVGTATDSAVERVAAISQEPVPDASSLAEVVENRMVEKWDWALGAELSTMSYARRSLRPEAAWAAFAELVGKPVGGGQRELHKDAESSKPATRVSTARNPGPPAHSVEFCVIDVETTGFSPRLGDRVVEVAAVRLTADGTILGEWSTLVDPQRDVGATHVHGIAAADLVAAPTFAQIAGDLLVHIDGAVIAAHNLRFDWGFLAAEYERAGHRLPRPPSICTIELGSRVLPDLPDRRLAGYCHALGIEHSAAHSAAADARATAGVLSECVRRVWDGRAPSLTALGCEPLTWPADMPALVASGRVSSRDGETRVAPPADYLARLVAGLDGHGETDAGVSAYLQTLDRMLADRQLTQVEASDMEATAQAWGLDDAALPQVHRRYLAMLCAAAQSDGHVSDTERQDLRRVERLLGIEALDDLLG